MFMARKAIIHHITRNKGIGTTREIEGIGLDHFYFGQDLPRNTILNFGEILGQGRKLLLAG